MVITLIGYRGCGKSTVAPLLARALGWTWVDADVALELRAKRSIKEIFATDGEPAFRDLEEQTLADLLKRERVVVAAGGGAVLRESNRTALRAAGPVVWLRAGVDVLEARLTGPGAAADRRPNLTAAGGRAEIETLLAAREPLYRATATFSVDAGDFAPSDVVAEILRSLPAVARSDGGGSA